MLLRFFDASRIVEATRKKVISWHIPPHKRYLKSVFNFEIKPIMQSECQNNVNLERESERDRKNSLSIRLHRKLHRSIVIVNYIEMFLFMNCLSLTLHQPYFASVRPPANQLANSPSQKAKDTNEHNHLFIWIFQGVFLSYRLTFHKLLARRYVPLNCRNDGKFTSNFPGCTLYHEFHLLMLN